VIEICSLNAKLMAFPKTSPKSLKFAEILTYMTPCPTSFDAVLTRVPNRSGQVR
jgi:hypothetical protein